MKILILKIISVAVKEMSQGELLQIEKSRSRHHIDTYFEIIRQKTATITSLMLCHWCKAVNSNKRSR